MKIASRDENCAGFNTLGFFKNKIVLSELKKSIYFKPLDGIYVKKKYIESIKKNIRIKCYVIGVHLNNYVKNGQRCAMIRTIKLGEM